MNLFNFNLKRKSLLAGRLFSILLLTVVLVESAVSQEQKNNAVYISDQSRYGLVKMQSEEYQKNILLSPVKIKFSQAVETRYDALITLLSGTGIKIGWGRMIPRTKKTEHDILKAQKLPTVLRTVGELPLGDVINLIAGKSWQYSFDEISQTINLYLKQSELNYRELRQTMVELGIIDKTNNATFRQYEKIVVNFSSGTKELIDVVDTSRLDKINAFLEKNSKTIEKILITGRSHSAGKNASSILAKGRAKSIEKYILMNYPSLNKKIELRTSVYSNHISRTSDAVVNITNLVFPEKSIKTIPHSSIPDYVEKELVVSPQCSVFLIAEGSLKQSIAENLSNCGYTIGDWDIKDLNSGNSIDYTIDKAYSFNAGGMLNFLAVIFDNYKLYSNINQLDASVDFSEQPFNKTQQ